MALTFTTAGESHGPAVIATLFGLPFGLALDLDWINSQLRRRQGGYGRGGRQNVETDTVEVLSGLRRGLTIGSPLTLVARNRDSRIDKAPDLANVRPGHVDLAGVLKIGSRNARDVLERASARETAARVMAGAACQGLLREFGIEVVAHVLSTGAVQADQPMGRGYTKIFQGPDAARAARDSGEFGTIDRSHDAALKAAIDAAKAAGDTLGGCIEIVALNLPPGLGSHNHWDSKLDGRLGQALMSIQAMKAVEIGLGAEAAKRPGSQVHDSVLPMPPAAGRGPYTRGSNNAGGLEGGVTNGEPLVCRVHMKPISTLMNPLPTVDVSTGEATQASTERSDTCAVAAAAIVAECAVAIVLAQALLEKTGGDSLDEVRRNLDGYLKSLRAFGGSA
ncbi:MAG: chorismate synthase [Planctomycetota bacterium]|nr:chorismate synthase [Planctomycetota bacterium]